MMVFTEEDAHDRKCPFVAFSDCRASGCMAWRWTPIHRQFKSPKSFEQSQRPEEPERPADVPESWEWVGDAWECDGEPNGWLEPEEEAKRRRGGYCVMIRET